MPKAKPPKNLVVDGTAKLAAKSKRNDKHEAPDLNIEEATVASPRPSRKRAGDYFDFDDGVHAVPSNKPAESKAVKPKKKTKTAPTGKDENSNEVEAKPTATAKRGKKGKGAKDEVANSPSETITETVEKEKKPRKPKVTKPDAAEEKPESSKKSKKATKEPAADKKPKKDATPKTTKAVTKAKAKKLEAKKGAAEEESSTIAPDAAMDEAPLETLLESEIGQVSGATEEKSSAQGTKAAKPAKKPARGSKASKIESAKSSAGETAAAGAESVKKAAKAGTEKVKKDAKTKSPTTDEPADVADVVRKGAKAGVKKGKQAVKSMAPAVETAADVAETLKKDAKAGAEKLKKGTKSKDPNTAKNNKTIKLTGSTEGPSKTEVSKSKKRKAPASADTETLKTDILDPLSEHASATKKQKKANPKSKLLGDAVGELLATATEGANAARASLGGLANSIMGGASEAAEEAKDAKELVTASAKTAKGKGKATADDVAESSAKIVASDGPGDANSEDNSDDEPDDHTAALLAGFESDGDEGPVPDLGFQQGQKIPQLPEAETTAKKLEGVKSGTDEGPGVVYVGRIPHGFYEHEMREYFSQFGDINRLRLSRNRKTGASRHYAFVEFNSAGVAKIVADTMDNYLMFGHILKCKMIAKKQLHESLWKGANKRFKAVPWNKIEGRKFEMGLGREQWAGRIEGEKRRRAAKNEKTKQIGYEFEAGELKGVEEVLVRDAAEKIKNGEKVEEEKSLVTARGEDGNSPVVVSEEVKTKRVKKVKGKAEEVTTTTMAKKTKRALDVGEEAGGSTAKKVKKGMKVAA